MAMVVYPKVMARDPIRRQVIKELNQDLGRVQQEEMKPD
jgi:hypothetical protein